MTKGEFLKRLREALANDLNGPIIQENVSYYDQYISEEINKGRTEQEILDELGDPWAIAQTIIDAQETSKESYNYYQNQGDEKTTYQDTYSVKAENGNRFGSIWKLILALLGILGIIFIVVTVVGGILSLVMPILVPILVVIFIRNIVRRMR